MIYRKLLTLVIYSFTVMQLSAQTLIGTIPNVRSLSQIYSSIGFENVEYLQSVRTEVGMELAIDIISTSTFAVEYTYSTPELPEGSSIGLSMLLNDINGNGHPEIVLTQSSIIYDGGEYYSSSIITIIDLGDGSNIFSQSHNSALLTASAYIDPAGDWNLLISIYPLYSPETETGAWIYDLNIAASTNEVAQYGTSKRNAKKATVYPNPSNGSSSIQYNLSEPGPISIAIFDNLGRVIYQMDKQFQISGMQTFDWSNSDKYGKPVPSGIYHAEIVQKGKRILASKITVLK